MMDEEFEGKKRKFHPILTSILILVFLYLAGSVIASFKIYDGIFRVSEPIISEAGCFDDYRDHLAEKNVTFTVYDKEIKGRLYFSYEVDDDKGILIVVNGMSCAPATHMPTVDYFASRGFRVLSFDGAGTGETGGDSQIGLSEQKVILQAVLETLPEDEPVYLYGHSAGAYAAVSVADNPKVRAVVAYSGFRSPMGLMREAARKKVGILADIETPFLALVHFWHFGPDGFTDPGKVLAETKIPVLIVQGNEDPVIPEKLSLYSLKDEIGKENLRFLMMNGGHIDLQDSPEALDEALTFFEEAAEE